jgi:hypothetical protein
MDRADDFNTREHIRLNHSFTQNQASGDDPMTQLPEYIDGLPNLSGSEAAIEKAIAEVRDRPLYLDESPIDFSRIKSAFANALHMHQPLIPAGGDDLRTARVISNLQHMFDNPGTGDNHNATVFRQCYERMGDFIPQLVAQGKDRCDFLRQTAHR